MRSHVAIRHYTTAYHSTSLGYSTYGLYNMLKLSAIYYICWVNLIVSNLNVFGLKLSYMQIVCFCTNCSYYLCWFMNYCDNKVTYFSNLYIHCLPVQWYIKLCLYLPNIFWPIFVYNWKLLLKRSYRFWHLSISSHM